MNRPKRIHRLPSRFADHSISPSKFIPIQPCHASTPLHKNKSTNKQTSKTEKHSNNRSPDSNNNPKKIRSARLKVKAKASPIKSSPKKLTTGKRILDKSLSFKILDDKKSKAGGVKLDEYAFTPLHKDKSTNKQTSKTDQHSNNRSPDSNNNPKYIRSARLKVKPKGSPIKSSPKKLTTGKRILDKSLSFKILDDKLSKAGREKLDEYEFTPLHKNKLTNKQTAKTDKHSNNRSPDSNDNPKKIRSARLKVKPKASPTKSSPKKLKTGKRILDKSLSFKILDDKKSKSSGEELDVYEFTFDPDEEPQPPKKKKKRTVKKKPSKPKTVVYKNNYDKNMSKAIAALKEVVAKYQSAKDQNIKEIQEQNVQNDPMQTPNVMSNVQVQGKNDNRRYKTSNKGQTDVQNKQTMSNAMPQILEIANPNTNVMQTQLNMDTTNLDAIKQLVNNGNKSVNENPPICVEDIEADVGISYHDDMNYSPVNSPRPSSLNPVAITQDFNTDHRETIERAIFNKDPLNLQDDNSFFDDEPVASSSMNVSVRHPLASPWRVEFGSLPIKWPANTYLKPNMTPAVESSFISSEDSNKKKHVYVNMIPQTDESLPQIVENNATIFKQTSIISFIKEVADRNANKKKRGQALSPIKASTLFEDITNKTNADIVQRPPKNITKTAAIGQTGNKDASNSSSNTSNDKENVRQTRKRKKKNAISKLPAKSPCKEKDSNVTYFGFDDSENHDMENAIPNRNIDYNKVRALRSRSRVLQEINCENRPARAALPAAKTKITSSSEAVKKMFEDLKSAEDAPLFLDKNVHQNAVTTNVEIPQNADIDNEDSESVHLFEDMDVVHHLKPTRKSYGKAKKVTFRQRSTSDSETQASDVEIHAQSSDEDDLADLSFNMPEIKQKKTRKKKTKKLMTKKEEKEADEWAAGFNSMCEDIEEFPLLVE